MLDNEEFLKYLESIGIDVPTYTSLDGAVKLQHQKDFEALKGNSGNNGVNANLLDSKRKEEQSTSPTVNPMLQRVRGISAQPKTSYKTFEDLVTLYGADGKISRSDRRNMRKTLGLSRSEMRHIAEGLNGGNNLALNSYTKTLGKRAYVDNNGKLIVEGEGDNFDPETFELGFGSATYSGASKKEAIDNYNKAILDWRKNIDIKYDAATGEFYTENGFGNTGRVDLSKVDWAQDKISKMNTDVKKAQENYLKNAKYIAQTDQYLDSDNNVINVDWFNNDNLSKKNLLLKAFGLAVDNFGTNGEKFNSYFYTGNNALDLLTKIGLDPNLLKDFDKKGIDEQNTIRGTIQDKMQVYHDNFMNSRNQKWEDTVQADAWWKLMQKNFLGLNWLGTLTWANGGRYSDYLGQGLDDSVQSGSLLGTHKQGGTLEKAKAYKKGGMIKKALIGALLGKKYRRTGAAFDLIASFIPGFNTINLGVGYFQGNVSGTQLALAAGMDILGPLAKAAKLGYNAYKLYKGATGAAKVLTKAEKGLIGARNTYNATVKAAMPAISKMKGFNKVKEALDVAKTGGDPKNIAKAQEAYNLFVKDAMTKINPKVVTLRADAYAAAHSAKTAALGAVPIYRTTAFNMARASNPSKLGWWYGPNKKLATLFTLGRVANTLTDKILNPTTLTYQNLGTNLDVATPVVPPGTSLNGYSLESALPYLTDADRYRSAQVAFNKQGGNLNMNKINYFQAGGVQIAPAQAAPAAAPELGGQDMQAQIMQLVQAAMSGDEQATKTIQQIMQAAQQGDQQAAQLALMIQEIAQQMQGQAPAAKNGAKLSYIKSLKSGCPEGYEVSYHREGGRICKECIAKNAAKPKYTLVPEPVFFNKCGGTAKKKAEDGAMIEKCGGKTKKNACGSKLKKSLKCGGKKCENGTVISTNKPSTTKVNPYINPANNPTNKSIKTEKCGGKAKKKCAEGGILTIENLQNAYKFAQGGNFKSPRFDEFYQNGEGKLIKAQLGSPLKKGVNAVKNTFAGFGQQLAMNSDPAVMLASGYVPTNQGVEYAPSESSKLLIKNLGTLGANVYAGTAGEVIAPAVALKTRSAVAPVFRKAAESTAAHKLALDILHSELVPAEEALANIGVVERPFVNAWSNTRNFVDGTIRTGLLTAANVLTK